MILELDSSGAILSPQKNFVHHPFSTLVAKIQELLARNWEVKVQHVYREANRAVDLLASLGHSLSIDLHVYFKPPLMLLPILSED